GNNKKEIWMIGVRWVRIFFTVLFLFASFLNLPKGGAMTIHECGQSIVLPPPSLEGKVSLEASLKNPRSVRSYTQEPLSVEDIGQLLWAAQGITSRQKFRTAPSAGALYPLEVYVACGNVKDLPGGIYRYIVHQHRLEPVRNGDHRKELASAALGQSCIREAPAVIIFTGVPSRITSKYGQRGIQYMMMEAGHAAQNVCLQAVARQLGTVPVGAFKENQIRETLQIADDQLPLYLIPVGKTP
ncbi:MAG: SagB/ThcOx family dehydrogenase, partial [Desulfobacterales bacterium]